MKKKLLRQTAIPVLTAACVFSQVGMAFSAISGSNTGYTAQAYTQGTWKQEAQGWKHYDANQKPSTGWIYTESGWYYIDPATGFMKTGWIQDEKGRWFYLETAADQGGVEGRLHTGWLKDPSGNWYFMNTVPGSDFGAMLTGWQWIDSSCYYFGTDAAANIGKLYMNTTTPDGYKVNADGRWVNADGSIRHDQKGIASAVKADGTPIEKESTTDSSDSGSDSSSSGGSHSSGNGGSSNSGNGSSNNGGSSNGSSSDNSGSNNNGGNNGNNGSDNNGGSNGNNGSDNNGSDNGNNGSDNNGSEDKDDQTTVSIVKEAKVMTADLGKWITVTFEDGYSSANCNVSVDGQDVTDYVSNVTDNGSIAKIPLVKATPGSITVTDKNNSKKTETLELSSNSSDDEDTVYTGSHYLPQKVMTHGSIPTWDYWLSNYDDKGNLRVSPAKTTFNLEAVTEEHPSYSPEAEIDDTDQLHVTGNVTIMFNYNTDEEKEWFNSISKLDLVEFDTSKKVIKSDLVYHSASDVPHGSGKVGKLTIAVEDNGIRTAGRYYVRVTSGTNSSVLVPIHLVSTAEPTISFKENPSSGKNLHFEIEGIVQGAKDEIERVTLTDPNGDIHELNKIDDWFFYNPLFVLYNDVTAENGTNHLLYNGMYTLTIYSNGYKTISKDFKITDGIEDTDTATLSVDAVSRATASVGGDFSSSGSSTNTSANLMFDTDLLVNALLLDNLDISTDAVETIVDYWYDVVYDSVFDKGSTKYYDWTDYVDTEVTADISDRFIPFDEYSKNGKLDPNRPYAVKEVLEDGLLGDVQYSNSYGRLNAPNFTVDIHEEGKNLVLSCSDKEYLSKISAIYLDGNWQPLTEDDYNIDIEKGTVTISQNKLSVKELSLVIDAVGYKSNTLSISYDKVNETDLVLEITDENITAGENGLADVSFHIKNSDGNFLTYLKSVTVTYIDAEGATKNHPVWEKNVSSADDMYYEISEDNKELTLKQVPVGSYTLTVEADYYDVALIADFEVKASAVTPKPEPTKTAPAGKKLQYVSGYDSYYRLSFDGNPDTIAEYLSKVSGTSINNDSYENTTMFIRPKQYKIFSENGVKTYIDFTTDSFNAAASNTILITANGYTDLSITFDANGNPASKDTTVTQDAPSVSYSDKISVGSTLTLTCDNDDYLKKISTVLVNNAENTTITATYTNGNVVLATDSLEANASVELTLKADGYTDQTITISIVNSTSEENEAPYPISAEKDVWSLNYPYVVSFSNSSDETELTNINAYLTSITSIEVGNVTYSSSEYTFGTYIGAYGSYKTKIKFSSDGFSITDSTEITIYASGYSELTFSIAADGSLVTTVSENSSNYDNITVGTNTVEEISDTTDSSEVSELNNTVEANRVNESLNDTTEVRV